MKRFLLTIFLLISGLPISSQTLKGQLKLHAGQEITLKGFNYYDSYELAKTTLDSLGNFSLSYPADYRGMAILRLQDRNNLVVLLAESDITIQGTHIRQRDSLRYINSHDNTKFLEMAVNIMQAQQAYAAWRYLQTKYEKDEALNSRKKIVKAIIKEVQRIESELERNHLEFDKESYFRWFIPQRKLVNDMPASAKNYKEKISKNISRFRTTDFAHPNFKTSGLYKELIEGHYDFLEKIIQSKDSMYAQMNISTRYLIDNLRQKDSLLNKTATKLFEYFDQRRHLPAVTYLSEQLLAAQCRCNINTDLKKKLQKYSVLKQGNIAPDIQLNHGKKLSDIKKKVLVVFGASSCPYCVKQSRKLVSYYKQWKTQMEVVYISLDTDPKMFNLSFQHAPWKYTFCDFKAWETPAVKEYHITNLPAYVLLDEDRKVLAHPVSITEVSKLFK